MSSENLCNISFVSKIHVIFFWLPKSKKNSISLEKFHWLRIFNNFPSLQKSVKHFGGHKNFWKIQWTVRICEIFHLSRKSVKISEGLVYSNSNNNSQISKNRNVPWTGKNSQAINIFYSFGCSRKTVKNSADYENSHVLITRWNRKTEIISKYIFIFKLHYLEKENAISRFFFQKISQQEFDKEN